MAHILIFMKYTALLCQFLSAMKKVRENANLTHKKIIENEIEMGSNIRVPVSKLRTCSRYKEINQTLKSKIAVITIGLYLLCHSWTTSFMKWRKDLGKRIEPLQMDFA